MAKRSVYCGQVSEAYVGQEVTLKGWVQKRRDLGGVIFVDLRDREGFCQVVFNQEYLSEEDFNQADKLRSEYVIEITGKLDHRAEDQINPKIPTGHYEVYATSIILHAKSKTPCDLY